MSATNTALELHKAIYRALATDPGFRGIAAGDGVYDLAPVQGAPFPYAVIGDASDDRIVVSGGRDPWIYVVRLSLFSARNDRKELLEMLHAIRGALANLEVAGHSVADCSVRQLTTFRDPSSTVGRPMVVMHLEVRVALQPLS